MRFAIFWLILQPMVALCQVDDLADIAAINQGAENFAHITYAPGTATSNWPTPLAEDRDVSYIAADFDADGSDDIACIDFESDDDPVAFVTSGPGQTNDSQELWINKLRENDELAFYFVTGDFNGDSYKDIAMLYLAASGDDEDVLAKLTYGPNGATQSDSNDDWQFTQARDAAFVAGSFVNNDAVDDIAVISRNGNDFHVNFYAGPIGTFDNANQWDIVSPSLNDQPVAFRSGDFNGDGELDIAAAFYNSVTEEYAARIVFGPSGATNKLWDLGDEELVAILAEDFNGDGITDIAAIQDNGGTRTAAIHIADNNGEVAEVRTWSLESDAPNITQYLVGTFATPAFDITGFVYQQNGTTGLANATVQTDQGHSTTTAADGSYTLSAVENGSYTISVTKAGYSFAPATRPATVNNATLAVASFVATANPAIHTISGRVYNLDQNTGLAGVTINAGGNNTVTTDNNGNYSITTLANGNYTITATKLGYSFTDDSLNISINGANRTNVDFTVETEFRYTVSGTVSLMPSTSQNPRATTRVVQGAVVTLGALTTTTDAVGRYSFSNILPGSYQLSAQRPGYTISPDNFTSPVVITNANRTNLHFKSRCNDSHSQVSGVCVDNNALPGVAGNLVASDGTSDKHVNVSWQIANNASSYQLYRSRFAGEKGVAVGEPQSNTTLLDTGAVPGVQYYYSVEPLNDLGPGAMSNQDAGHRGDLDESALCRYQDELEQQNGCEFDTQQFALKSPVYSGYNTFMNQLTFLELAVNGPRELEATVTIIDNLGAEIARVPVSIEANGQFDLNLSDYVDKTHKYGTIKIEYDDSATDTKLSGRVSHYSMTADGQRIAFAYTRELGNPSQGESYITANTLDPSGMGRPVINWSEIFNIENVGQHFTYRLFDQVGEVVDQVYDLYIPAHGRFDILAGEIDREAVYLVEIVPHEGSLRYLAGVSRYGDTREQDQTTPQHTFAYPVSSRVGSGEKQYVIVSNEAQGCWSQLNWVEMGNARSRAVNVSLIFRNPEGIQLGTTTVEIPAKGLYHVNASAMLPYNSIGSLELVPDRKNSLVTESVVYFHDCEENKAQAAYSTASRKPGTAKQIGSYNSFLGAQNRLQLLNVTNASHEFELFVAETPRGNAFQQLSLGPKSISQILFDQNSYWQIEQNTYGTVNLYGLQEKLFIGEHLRIKQDANGKIEFVIPSTLR